MTLSNLELNVQRATVAQRFYQQLFGWESKPLHIDPFGMMPLLVNRGYELGPIFMAMGAFATPRWFCLFETANVDKAMDRAVERGATVRGPAGDIPGWGRQALLIDPEGRPFGVYKPSRREIRRPARAGDPAMAELWCADGEAAAAFYSETFETPPEADARGWSVGEAHIRTTPFDSNGDAIPGWIPYFRSASPGADLRRAQLLDAIVQVPEEETPFGRLAILVDPAGAYFGLAGTA